MIKLKYISKSFGKQKILKDLNFSASRGEHIMLTGASGCGKSTLLRIMIGLEVPDSGTVEIDGMFVTRDAKLLVQPVDRAIGYVPQDLGLWGNLSVVQNVLLGRKIDRSYYIELLAQSGLSKLELKKAGLLSAGERQRVALLRALVSRPKILILDEPFANLDLILKQDYYSAVKDLVDAECTVISVSHDPIDWNGLNPDRLTVIEDGIIKDDQRANSMDSESNSELLRKWKSLRFWNC